MKKPYRYSVPGGEIVEAVGEWRTDVPESSYNQPVLELILQEDITAYENPTKSKEIG